MAFRGGHQGPWVRHIPALLLLGYGAHTRGSTTKSKDQRKSSQGSKETWGKAIGRRLQGAQRAEANKAEQIQEGQSISTSTQPTEEGNTTLGCTVSILQNLPGLTKASSPGPPAPLHLAHPQLPPGCRALGTTGKDAPPSLPEERDKGTGHAQGIFPSSQGRQPLLAPVVIKGLSIHVIH